MKIKNLDKLYKDDPKKLHSLLIEDFEETDADIYDLPKAEGTCPHCDGPLQFVGYQGYLEEFKCPECNKYFYFDEDGNEVNESLNENSNSWQGPGLYDVWAARSQQDEANNVVDGEPKKVCNGIKIESEEQYKDIVRWFNRPGEWKFDHTELLVADKPVDEMTKDELVIKYKYLKDCKFNLDMKDHWSREDFELSSKYHEEMRTIGARLEQLEGNTNESLTEGTLNESRWCVPIEKCVGGGDRTTEVNRVYFNSREEADRFMRAHRFKDMDTPFATEVISVGGGMSDADFWNADRRHWYTWEGGPRNTWDESLEEDQNLDEAKNDTLNPAIWDGDELRPEVKKKLIYIADVFIDKLLKDGVPLDVKDVIIVGSNANYNYTPYSDIDLHISADLSEFKGREKELVEKIYQCKKAMFNDRYDPVINGFNVELYIEPAEDKNNNEIPDEVEEPIEEPNGEEEVFEV